MEIKLEKNLEKCEARFNATVEGDEWKDACEKASKALAAKVTVKGFRQGKAPLAQALKYVRPQEILEKAADKAVAKAYDELAKSKDVTPFLQPELVVNEFNDKKLSFSFVIVTRPTLVLGDYKGLTVEKEATSVTEEDITNELNSLALKNAEQVVVEGDEAAVKGDTVVIDFKGFVDDKPFDGGEASAYELELGSNTFVPGFEDQLIGVKTNEEKVVNIKFPENYVEPLAGKDARFEVKVNSIKHKVIPAIDDDFAKDLDYEGVDTLDQLKEYLNKQVATRKENQAANNQYNKLIDEISTKATFLCHEKVLKKDAERIVNDFKNRLSGQGFDLDDYFKMTKTTKEDLDKQALEEAYKTAKQAFLFEEIANKEGISVSDADLEAKLAEMATTYKMDVETIKKQLGNRIDNFRYTLKQDKVNEFLKANNNL